MSHDDFEFEPIRGLPAVPPAGEQILWQGKPEWQMIARRVFQLDNIAIYFGLLFAWRFGYVFYETQSLAASLLSVARVLPLAIVGMGLLALFAWFVGRTTVYTITSSRVVMRFGMALPMTINLPFGKISNVDLKLYSDGTGDIPLTLPRNDGFGYFVLWPHARPFRLAKPQPMLRGVADAANVAEILGKAMAQASLGATSATVSAGAADVPTGTKSEASSTKVVAWPQVVAAE